MTPTGRFLRVILCCLGSASSLTFASEVTARRLADLELLRARLLPVLPVRPGGRINAVDRTWEDWLKRTGELPPDFDAMPSCAELPDPLMPEHRRNGVRITGAAEWEQQRQWIRRQIEQWLFGRMPPAPGNLRVASSSEHREDSLTIRDVVLEFGPDHRAKLTLQLVIPDGPGPFPVFLTNHSRERSTWIHTAVNRGYLACYYRATDPVYGHSDDSDGFVDVYPEYDFTVLARWAWAASRAVDYLVTLPNVARNQIGIAGHSRNGKQALLAAAFDERIAAVVASSGLQGESLPYRYTSDPYMVESIQFVTTTDPHWFHPRLRFFAGREHKLPVDQNSLMALVAPRGLMIYASYQESNANAFALEQAYRSVRDVYRFCGHEERVWFHLREGDHPTETGDVENFIDFFDTTFGRASHPRSESWIIGYDFEAWKRKSGKVIDPVAFPARKPGAYLSDLTVEGRAFASEWERRRSELRAGIQKFLGPPPPTLAPPLSRSLRENSPPARNPAELVFGRPQRDSAWQQRLAQVGMGSSGLSFGPGLQADVFYPLDAAGKRRPGRLPVVVWLHAYSHAQGWSSKLPWAPNRASHYLDQRPSFDSLVRRGFIVVAFDQIGFGSRADEGRQFYERYPEWSLLGKMVTDTRSVVEALRALEEVDPARIFLLGYSLGAKVGLLTAALDDRVGGVAAICGVDPIRLRAPDGETEGIRHYSHLHGLLPQLGFFIGHEERAPFDYDEVLALNAPRPLLIVAPELDRFAPIEAVRQEVAPARAIYARLGQESSFEFRTPRDFNRFPRGLQEEVFTQLERMAAPR